MFHMLQYADFYLSYQWGSKNRTMAQEDLHLHLLVKWFHTRLVRKTINYSLDRAKSENSWLVWLFD